MWTALRFNNIEKNDVYLTIWHLPAEKKLGFIYLFNKIKLIKPSEMEKDKFIKICRYSMGIPNKKIIKKIRAILYKIKYRIQR